MIRDNDRYLYRNSVLACLKFRTRCMLAGSGFIPGCELSKSKGMAEL